MKIFLYQSLPKLFNKEDNLKTIKSILYNNDSDLFIFPEMFLTGYIIGDEVYRLAETPNGKYINDLKMLVNRSNKYAIVGMPIEEKIGVFYNVALFTDGETIAYQKKRYLPNFGPFNEKRYFTAGTSSITANIDKFTVGISICYDAFFPNIVNEMQDIDMLVIISASPITSKSNFEKILPALAIDNGIYVVYVNMHGIERWSYFWGGSRVIDPGGNTVYMLSDVDEGTFNIDLSEVKHSRIFRHAFKDKKI